MPTPMPTIDETHAPGLGSWVDGADTHFDFPIQNLPLGVFSVDQQTPRGGIAIGAMILDLAALAHSDLLEGEALAAAEAASGPTLNPLLALGTGPRRALRRAVSALLATGAPKQPHVAPLLVPAHHAEMHLPARIGDYSDFYVGIHHAAEVGALFRPEQPLLPNYKHIPIGYHGRASTIRPSGSCVIRPNGQTRGTDADTPRFGPTQRLDFELELGLWIGPGNAHGEPVPLTQAWDHMAGLTLLNDWSARDIQAWEYQPLGPFLSKSFHTTVSPWIVTTEAMAPFRIGQPSRADADPGVLPYLQDAQDQGKGALALDLEVTLSSAAMRARAEDPQVLSHTQARTMYWTLGQMVAHHTVNGCALESGDLLGTGTLSGPEPGSKGSLLEITCGGAQALQLPRGETRTFLEDGDEVVLKGRFMAEGRRSIGFGECRGLIAPAPAI